MLKTEIGAPPWSDNDIRAAYSEFKKVYAARPIADNAGGMKAPHALGCWFMLKSLRPKVIIESGVWKGQGTWLIEQACPDAEVVCLDISFNNLEYRSAGATYIEKDFSVVDFAAIDKTSALVFFDDHQNALMRLQQLKWKGFNQAIFEDNYAGTRGDCYSIKKMLGDFGFVRESPSRGFLNLLATNLRALLGRRRPDADAGTIEPNSTHRAELIEELDLYYEFPPLFKEDTTRWGDNWSDADYPTKAPLFDQSQDDSLRIESRDYTWMCLVNLKSNAN